MSDVTAALYIDPAAAVTHTGVRAVLKSETRGSDHVMVVHKGVS